MLPGAYVFRIRNLWTANSLTSRNICSAPPARTLMLNHYSVATAPSQGIAPHAFPSLHPLCHRPALVPALIKPVCERLYRFVAVLLSTWEKIPSPSTGFQVRAWRLNYLSL